MRTRDEEEKSENIILFVRRSNLEAIFFCNRINFIVSFAFRRLVPVSPFLLRPRTVIDTRSPRIFFFNFTFARFAMIFP